MAASVLERSTVRERKIKIVFEFILNDSISIVERAPIVLLLMDVMKETSSSIKILVGRQKTSKDMRTGEELENKANIK